VLKIWINTDVFVFVSNGVILFVFLFSSFLLLLFSRRWYGPGRIGRDFRPRHAMLTMHVWFLHKRLLADTYDTETALSIDEEFFTIFWDDTTSRIRKAGVTEMAVNKMLMQVQQYTFLHLTHYDHIYSQFLDKPEERLIELRKLVAHHIFVRDPKYEQSTDHLDRIAWYIDMNYRNIMLVWPDAYYREARVQWVDCPDFTNIRDEHGRILPNIPVDPEDLLPEPWLRNITRRGDEYYWNPITRESRWIRPTVGGS
jgi:cytochrome b pre-mRNA-processing protein 3